ncbi:MAG TPA: signal recognition particle-docking protein FtsY [Dehalococcoidia bacterium]|nr:signal recognition particle-docking protein FtsY [Dehalococcoidia bacterium]
MTPFGRRSKDDASATEQALAPTRRSWLGRLSSAFRSTDVTDELWESLEEVLIGADAGVGTTMAVLDRVRASKPGSAEELRSQLRDELVDVLEQPRADGGGVWDDLDAVSPAVVLVVGVNGSGKTTAIARLAHLAHEDGRTVLCAAGDTYRAAAIEQLQTWGERLGFDVIAHQQGGDAAAVSFDAIDAAKARGSDLLLIDTAGRLQSRQNLMDELAKVGRVIERGLGRSADEVLLVIDATTGQNGLAQARAFTEAVHVTGVILTKLDGTAKGGIVFAIADDLGLPVRFVGTGQHESDVAAFEPAQFVDALLAPSDES